MPEHVVITDPNIHEPKGASTAAAGQTYVSDGLGSGSWQQSALGSLTKSVTVRSMSDFPAPVSGVITLEAETEYVIVERLTTSDRFVMSQDTLVRSSDAIIYTITYTGTGTLFTGVDISYAIIAIGIIALTGTILSATDVTTPGSSVVFVDVCIFNADVLGTISNIDSFITTNCTFGWITDGFSFTGSSNRQAVSHLCELYSGGGAYYTLGTALFDAVSVNDYAIDLAAGSNVISAAVSSANINAGGLGFISFGRHRGAGTPLSGATVDDSLWQFIGNDIIPDTRPATLETLTANATSTNISSSGVPVLTAGTWVSELSSQFDSTAAGRLTYTGGKDVCLAVTISATLSPDGGGSRDLELHLYKGGVAVTNATQNATISSSDPGNIVLVWELAFSTNDYIELWISNNTNTTDITVSKAAFRVN